MDANPQPDLLNLGLVPATDADVPRVAGPFAHPPEDFVTEPDPAEEELGPLEDPTGEPPALPPDDPAVNDFIRLAAAIYASPAAQAFAERRLALQQKHGADAVTDLSRGAYAICGSLAERVQAARERLSARHPTPETLELARQCIETAGALAMALHDAITSESGNLGRAGGEA